MADEASVPAAQRINRKWLWHYRALLTIRDRLLEDLSQEGDALAEPIERHGLNMADSASDEFDHGFAASEISAQQNTLWEVNEAISRILDGTYGKCESTGKAISAARLRAVPWTRFSKRAQKQLEDQQAISCGT